MRARLQSMGGNKETIAGLAELVRPGGHVVSMKGAADEEALRQRGLGGVNVRTQAMTDKLERLAGQVRAGRLRRPEITNVPLAETARALKEVAGSHVRGKLVLVP